MAEVVRRHPSQTENGSSSSRSFSQSPQKKGLHRSDSFSNSSSSPTKKHSSPNGHHKKSSSVSSLPNSPSKEERKRLAKEILASGSDQLRATLKQRGMLHALLSDPVKFIKSNTKQGQDYTTLGLIPVNDPNFAAAQKRKLEQKQHSLLLHTDSPKINGNGRSALDDDDASAASKGKSRDLYPYKISLRFPGKVRPAATGLSNYGNTCYMNSVMQSLVHTPPFAFALLTQDLDSLHGDLGGKPNANFDAVTAMQNFAKRSLQGTRTTNAPQEFNRNLKAFAKPLRQGRQEDAHEYLRFLLEALQQSCLARAPKSLKPDDPIRRTTFVQKMFGGKLRSRVTCHNCGYNSDTFDPFMDLSLDVRKGINSLTDAFRAFVAKDHLSGSEKYKCDKCKRKVDATKQFTIETAPPALTIHLKRFTPFGTKISRQLAFEENLNIAPYLSVNNGPARYKLYAAVHHYGSGPNSGHYVASVKSPSGKWTRMDDSMVSEMGRSGPFNDQSAYILFYLKEKDEALERALAAVAPTSNTKKAAATSKGLANGDGKKRKHVPQEEDEESEAEEEDQDAESGDEFDDQAAYQALLKRRKKAALASASPVTAASKSRKSESDDEASDTPSETGAKKVLSGTSSKLDKMLSSQPKSTASFYGGASASSSRPLPSNPFSMPTAEDEEMGTTVDREEYESLVSTPASLSPQKKAKVLAPVFDPEMDTSDNASEDDDDEAAIAAAALSKKQKRKQKKLASSIMQSPSSSSKSGRGIPSSPYASPFSSSLTTGAKEQKKAKKDKLLKKGNGGGFASRMKPRPSF